MWILGGCVVLVIGVAVIVGGAAWWAQRKIGTMVEQQTNPKFRDQNAKEMLGASTLPPGYFAGVNISVGIVRTARLTDKADADGFDKRGFVYNDSIRSSTSKVDDYLAGKSGNVLDDIGTRVRSDETLRDAVLDVNGQQVHYYVRRGEVSESNTAVPALLTLFTFKCPDGRDRWAVWFQREDPATPTAEIDVAGSVGDEKAIRDFLSYFNVCRKR